MIRRPPRSKRTDTLFPYTTLFRSACAAVNAIVEIEIGEIFAPSPARPARAIGHRHRVFGARRVRSSAESGPFGLRFIGIGERSEEHTSELQSLMRISYAVFCLKKKNTIIIQSKQISITIQHT